MRNLRLSHAAVLLLLALAFVAVSRPAWSGIWQDPSPIEIPITIDLGNAIVPVVGVRLCSTAGVVKRAAGSVLLAAAIGTALFGTRWTHVVIGRYEFVENGSMAIIEKALPHLGGCSTTLTSAPAVTQQHFGHTVVWYGIATPEQLQQALAFGRAMKGRGTLGFVVHPDHRNSPLTQLLDTMARPIVVDDIVVYRFRW